MLSLRDQARLVVRPLSRFLLHFFIANFLTGEKWNPGEVLKLDFVSVHLFRLQVISLTWPPRKGGMFHLFNLRPTKKGRGRSRLDDAWPELQVFQLSITAPVRV
jgi:hypothetical protein